MADTKAATPESGRTEDTTPLPDLEAQVAEELIAKFATAWHLLPAYDEQALSLPDELEPYPGVLQHEHVVDVIAMFKRKLMAPEQATEYFGQPRGDYLAAILGNLEQTMFGRELYRSAVEKVAHLLYFIVKDRPFVNGNKRIAALLFLLFLHQAQIEHNLNASGLTALTLLVAKSNAADKALIVQLIIHLISTVSSR